MHINKSSGSQDYNLDNARQSISGVYKRNENVSLANMDITGLTEVYNGVVSLSNCKVKYGDGNAYVSEFLVRVNNGSLNICNTSCVEGSVECLNGNINITDSHIDGDIKNGNGYIILKKAVGRNVITSNGVVELYQSEVSSVKNSNYDIVLDKTTVTGDVCVNNGNFYVNDSKVQGELELVSNNFTLGRYSEVNVLKLIHVDEPPAAAMSSLFKGVRLISWISAKFHGRGAYEPIGNVMQHITLENGAKLNHLEFTGKKCTLTLEGTAEYLGEPQEDLKIILAQRGGGIGN